MPLVFEVVFQLSNNITDCVYRGWVSERRMGEVGVGGEPKAG